MTIEVRLWRKKINGVNKIINESERNRSIEKKVRDVKKIANFFQRYSHFNVFSFKRKRERGIIQAL